MNPSRAEEMRGLSADLHLHVRKMTFRYGSAEPVLRDLDFELSPVSRIALMGPSGVGKSTLLKLLSGVLLPVEGTVAVHSGRAAAIEKVRFGYVSQDDTLLPWLTIKQSIAFTRKLVSGAGQILGTPLHTEIIESLGLNTHLNALPHQLSGGMRKRAALAACLISGAHLFVLDEPFSGSDILKRQSMYSTILRTTRACGAGLIFTTHDAVDTLELAKTVIWLGGPVMSELMILDARSGWTDAQKKTLSDLMFGGPAIAHSP